MFCAVAVWGVSCCLARSTSLRRRQGWLRIGKEKPRCAWVWSPETSRPCPCRAHACAGRTTSVVCRRRLTGCARATKTQGLQPMGAQLALAGLHPAKHQDADFHAGFVGLAVLNPQKLSIGKYGNAAFFTPDFVFQPHRARYRVILQRLCFRRFGAGGRGRFSDGGGRRQLEVWRVLVRHRR